MRKLWFLDEFFLYHPALYTGFFCLFGIAWFFYENLIFLLFVIFIRRKKDIIYAFICFGLSFSYCYFFYGDIKNIPKEITGEANFQIHSMKESYNFKKKYYIYKVTIKSFRTKEKHFKNIRCSIFSKKKFSLDHAYSISGKLKPQSNYYFQFQTNSPWIKGKKVYNLVKLRHVFKNQFKKYLKNNFSNKFSADFLHILMTGVNTSNFLSYNFGKIGLQHVIAISGFHFGIFTLFFTFFLRMIFPQKILVYILIAIINLYFLFIGPLISVERAYLMIQLIIFAQIFNRKYLPLNALGFSLIVILFINPLNITNIGFQLSFLCSFAILVAFPILGEVLEVLIKKRTNSERSELNSISRIAEKFLIYIRQSISLSLVVNTFILPVILFHFHKFSYLSFIYNLLIPFLVGISMILIMIGGFFYILIPPIGLIINHFNSFYTNILLKLITYPPSILQAYLRYKNISFEFVICYLFLITILFMFLRDSLKKEAPIYCYFI